MNMFTVEYSDIVTDKLQPQHTNLIDKGGITSVAQEYKKHVLFFVLLCN